MSLRLILLLPTIEHILQDLGNPELPKENIGESISRNDASYRKEDVEEQNHY